jgi:6-pyruvoyltetrahydropterin/6-carboxytetrahydropterin synthase
MMYGVTKEIYFCYGHRLLKYRGQCRYLHGHNGKVEIELCAARLDPLGMVIDFGKIKSVIKDWIDRNLDHRMILHAEDPLIPVLRKIKEPFFTLSCNPTAENIAKVIYEYAEKKGFPVSKVTLWETPSSFATYHR